MLVLCEVFNIDGTPHATNTRAAAPSRSPSSSPTQEAMVRHRAGVHLLQGRPSARLPGRRLPRPAGRLLLRRRRRRGLRPRDRRDSTWTPASTAGLTISGINAEVMPGQWEFQIGPVGPARGRRPPVGRPLAALPHRRGVRRRRDPRRQAGQGRLERRRRAHQLLHQGHARGLRRDHHRLRVPRRRQARSTEHVTSYGDGIEERLTGPHETAPWRRLQLRRLRPRRLGPHPVAGRGRQEGLHRGPPPERQRRPVRRDPPDRQHLLHRAGEGRPGLTTPPPKAQEGPHCRSAPSGVRRRP